MRGILKNYLEFVQMPTSHKGELISIQWLRGLAVVMVLIYHLEDIARLVPPFENFHSPWVRVGYSAPDLFFVISGFIMCYVTFGMRFDPKRWLVSRFVRIYPVYMFFTFIAFCVWLIRPDMTMGSGPHTWETLAASFLILPQSGLPLVFVGWTVEHEIVFYAIVFGVAACGGGVRTLVAVTGILSVLGTVRYMLRDSVPGLDFWDYHFLSLFMIEFFMGAALFQFRDRLRPLGVILPAAAGIALFISGAWLSEPGAIDREPLSRILVYGTSFTLFLLAAINWEHGQRALKGDAYLPKRRPFLVRVGDSSYSMYLAHPFCMSAGLKLLTFSGLTGWAAIPGILAIGAFTVIFGFAFYELAEKPFLQMMKVVLMKKKLPVAAKA